MAASGTNRTVQAILKGSGKGLTEALENANEFVIRHEKKGKK